MEIGFRQVGAEPEESEIRGVEVVLSRSMRISCSIVSKARKILIYQWQHDQWHRFHGDRL